MKFYRCEICGKIEMINYGDEKKLMCCGKETQELKSKSVDAAFEKHVPYCSIENDKINVIIGEALHPMSEEHYIVFIAQVLDGIINKIDLKPGEEPKAVFDYIKGSKIYAYCNLHGLWESSEL